MYVYVCMLRYTVCALDIHVYMYVCMYVCMYVYMYVCINVSIEWSVQLNGCGQQRSTITSMSSYTACPFYREGKPSSPALTISVAILLSYGPPADNNRCMYGGC